MEKDRKGYKRMGKDDYAVADLGFFKREGAV
jgi:hypothetical protein